MDKYSEIVNSLSKAIVDASKKISETLKFDRTSEGVILDVNENIYTVLAFGKQYKIYSNKQFNINQVVYVTAPQNNFKKLFIREM